jgi:hypothetical protein
LRAYYQRENGLQTRVFGLMIAAEAMAKTRSDDPQTIDPSIDPILEPLLGLHDRFARDEALGTLLTQHADPVIRRGLRHRFGTMQSPEIEDIRSSVIVRLLNRLERVDDPEADRRLRAASQSAANAARQSRSLRADA